jgi:hypothetical protein
MTYLSEHIPAVKWHMTVFSNYSFLRVSHLKMSYSYFMKIKSLFQTIFKIMVKQYHYSWNNSKCVNLTGQGKSCPDNLVKHYSGVYDQVSGKDKWCKW